MRDVLAELTRIVLGLFAEEKVHTTIEATYLDNVMGRLRDLDDARIEEYIPDDLVPEILRLASILETASNYADHYWVQSLQSHAKRFKLNITRVKRRPDTTYESIRHLFSEVSRSLYLMFPGPLPRQPLPNFR